MPKLNVTLDEFMRRTTMLDALADGVPTAPPKYQSAIGELIFLRLFSLLEVAIEEVTTKIVCGARYLDGSVPGLLYRARSAMLAHAAMRKLGRPKTIDLKWTIGSDIRSNVTFCVVPGDAFFSTVVAHEARIDEMRRIRNHIAHSNSDTLRKYKPVVVSYYGAYVPRITPAALLQSSRFSPPLLKQYLSVSRTVVKELTRG